MKCRSHKIDNCYKLSLSQSVMHPFRPSFALALFFREKRLNIYSCYLYFKEVPPSVLPFNLISLCVPSPCCERAPPLIQCTIHASSPLIFLQGNQINKWINKQLPMQYYSCHFLRYHLHKKAGSRGKKRDLYFLQHFSLMSLAHILVIFNYSCINNERNVTILQCNNWSTLLKICSSIKRTGHMLTYKNSRFKKCRRASTKYRGNKRRLKQKFDPDVP